MNFYFLLMKGKRCKFVNPVEVEITIAQICTRKQETEGFW